MPGRKNRAQPRSSSSSKRGEEEEEEEASPSTKSGEREDVVVSDDEDDRGPPPSKPAAGWGEAPAAGATKGGRRSGRGRAAEEAPKVSLGKRSSGSSRHWDDDDGEDDDIPMIPELDDDDGVDEELAKISAVANAPKAVRRTVMSKAELDHEIRHVVPTAVVDGRTQIDLSILKSSLSPKDAVDEPDVPWVFDSLLQEVSQAMERDAERAAAGGGADGEDLF
mgnify:FL=1